MLDLFSHSDHLSGSFLKVLIKIHDLRSKTSFFQQLNVILDVSKHCGFKSRASLPCWLLLWY